MYNCGAQNTVSYLLTTYLHRVHAMSLFMLTNLSSRTCVTSMHFCRLSVYQTTLFADAKFLVERLGLWFAT